MLLRRSSLSTSVLLAPDVCPKVLKGQEYDSGTYDGCTVGYVTAGLFPA